MGAARSVTVALAALLAGSVASVTLVRAQSRPDPREAGIGLALDRLETAPAPLFAEALKDDPAETGALGQDPAASSAVTAEEKAKPAAAAPAAPEAPKAEAPSPGSSKFDPSKLDPSKPEAPKPAAAEAPASVPPATPSDPLAAAIAARLSGSMPLLPRFSTKDREAVQAFYALGAFKPVWIVDGQFTPAARAVAVRLSQAGEDGLDPAAYPVPTLGRAMSEAETAQAEVKFSAAAALYARDARGGRIVPSSLSKLITPVLDLPSPDVVLAQVAAAGEQAGDVLQRYNPRTAGYLALKARLAALRGPVAAPVASASTLALPHGPMLRLGMRDGRVPLLRAHFGLEARSAGTLDAAPGEPEAYDATVAAAVADFQRSRGLHASGNLNAQTVMALAGAEQRMGGSLGGGDESALLVNMERWRWLPSDLGPDYVLVNVPEYRLRIFRDGSLRDETRVIVGKTDSPTPLFSGMMEYAVVNPSWYVPPSILKTMLAQGRTGGFEVVRHGNTISLRQPPGERNALGFIKFMFPNQHAVYLHDTPNRSLFSRSERALSHGCVRVDDPFRFADSVLPDAWTSEKLKKLIGKGERTIQLGRKLPVHLAYFTAYVDDLGSYRTLPDVYGYDARMRSALGLSGGAPAMVRGPAEPARVVAVAPDPAPAARRSRAVARAAVPSPRRYAAQPAPRRAGRYPADFGEPGLMTPRVESSSRSHGWW